MDVVEMENNNEKEKELEKKRTNIGKEFPPKYKVMNCISKK